MKYLFDMGEVWHVYSDVGKQWVYQRLNRVSEEILEKDGENLPGPLGKLDILKQLEQECTALKQQMLQLQQENQRLEKSRADAQSEIKERERIFQEKESQQKEALLQTEEQKRQQEERHRQELEQWKKTLRTESITELEKQRNDFEQSYTELKTLAEDLQKEGKIWRQRYLDLAYQVAPKEN